MQDDDSEDPESLRWIRPGSESGWQDLLKQICELGCVAGAQVISRDGFVLASTLPVDLHDPVASAGLSFYTSAKDLVCSDSIGHGRLHQVFGRTSAGCLHVADFGTGYVITVMDSNDLNVLIAVAKRVTRLVN